MSTSSPECCAWNIRQDRRRHGIRTAQPGAFRRSGWRPGAMTILPLVLLSLLGACRKGLRTDMMPLDNTGMSYSSIKELRDLDVVNAEVLELVKAKQAGFSDQSCVELVRIIHGRNQPFRSGDAVAGLRQAGVSELVILELARLDQVGLWAGQAQAMRLAGLSDAVILEVARHRAEGKPVLSGASLAELKNVGVSESTLLELAHRGVPDDQKSTIVLLRQRKWNDAQILHQYPAP
jgi:hypothetical protein